LRDQPCKSNDEFKLKEAEVLNPQTKYFQLRPDDGQSGDSQFPPILNQM